VPRSAKGGGMPLRERGREKRGPAIAVVGGGKTVFQKRVTGRVTKKGSQNENRKTKVTQVGRVGGFVALSIGSVRTKLLSDVMCLASEKAKKRGG